MKRKYFKSNEEYFNFYKKMRGKIDVKKLYFTPTKIALVYGEING